MTDAYAKRDPLRRERALDRCRWRLLEDIAFEDPYGLSGVLSFAVKLHIAARWAALEDEEGRKRVQGLIEESLKDKVPAVSA